MPNPRPLALLLALCLLPVLGVVAQQPAAPAQAAGALALKLTMEMELGQYQNVYAAMDPQMQQSITVDSLGQLWQNIVLADGAFQTAVVASEQTAADATQAYVRCTFANAAVYLRWSFDPQSLAVSGIEVTPTDVPVS